MSSLGSVEYKQSQELNDHIYLDCGASTPCDPQVAQLMFDVATKSYANASSNHLSGRTASNTIETSREQVAETIGGLPEEIIFTSGATESNNLAIQGLVRAAYEMGVTRRRSRIVTIAIEHPSVLQSCKTTQDFGIDLDFVQIERSGRIDLSHLKSVLDDRVLLTSIQLANNEIGTIQPVSEISEFAHECGSVVHTDAAQALGKIPIDLNDLGVDLASFSAHKCYGPKGIGALWISNALSKSAIKPLLAGGEQESGLRPGTLNTPGIAGFGLCTRLARTRLEADQERATLLRDRFETGISQACTGTSVNGDLENRLPNLTSVSLKRVNADALVSRLRTIDISTTSACHTGRFTPSHVLLSIGLSEDQAFSTIRLCVSRTTTERQVDKAIDQIARECKLLRPLETGHS